MAFDGAFLRALKNEIERSLLGLKVDKISEPERDEIVIAFRGYGETLKLLISVNADCARVNITDSRKENPIAAPMFCMLLRKHLTGARLKAARQDSLERVLTFVFDTSDEFGEMSEKSISAEIMGRYSNIVFYAQDGKIIDALKHVDITVSSRRQILPGLIYCAPPKQNKTDPFVLSDEEIRSLLTASNSPLRADKFLLETFSGLSPLNCREIAFLAFDNWERTIESLDLREKERMSFYLIEIMEMLKDGKAEPYMVMGSNNKPLEFSFLKIGQYGNGAQIKRLDSFSSLVESYYGQRAKIESMRQKSLDISKLVSGITERVSKKLSIQLLELEKTAERDLLKMKGDILTTNLGRISKGVDLIYCDNYYDLNGGQIAISLDPRLTPSQNAQKYYRDYNRLKSAEKYLKEMIKQDKNDLQYMESIADAILKAENIKELGEIRAELSDAGYIKKSKGNKKEKAIPPSKPMHFVSSDGFDIFVGKNNKQNDLLTFKISNKDDVWFHVKNIPGSHTVISALKTKVPDSTLAEAAKLCASYSKAAYSSNVPVDYTLIRNVRKPSNFKPGMVLYDNFKTIYVKPDIEWAKDLRKE